VNYLINQKLQVPVKNVLTKSTGTCNITNRYLIKNKEATAMNDNSMELYEKFRKLQWLIQRQRMTEMSNQNPFSDTTRGQGRVLALLKIQPEISTKDLAYLLGIRQQSLNELLNKLEKGEYVERKQSEADKRVMIIHLTEKGKNVQQAERNFPDIFGVLNEEEQIIFADYLERIIKSLEEEMGISPNDMDEWIEKARATMGEDRLALLMERAGIPFGDMESRAKGTGGFMGGSPMERMGGSPFGFGFKR
jgi:DNA-binding MarR family transcriptional regulator